MEVELLDNVSRTLSSAISPTIEAADDVKIAVAFVSNRGIEMIDPALQTCLQRGGSAEFLVGLDLFFTQPEAIRLLCERSNSGLNVSCYCFADLEASAVYHPKLYLMMATDEVTAVVGSSNLTEGGLESNLEVNAVIRATRDEEVFSDIVATYNALKFHPQRVLPDEEFLALYEELHSRRSQQDTAARSDAKFRELRSRFRDKASTLGRPVATREDLYGWQRLVYDRLSPGDFRTSDVYEFEKEFRSQYPDNRHIRAKVRQVLQQLRDLGLIKHAGRGSWVR
jgi:HKD family nuclease